MTFLWYVTEQYGICPFQVYLLESYELLIPKKKMNATMYREAGARLQVYYAHAAMHTGPSAQFRNRYVCMIR